MTLAERQDHDRAVVAARGAKATPIPTATRKAREAAERAAQTVAAVEQVAGERMPAMLAAVSEHRLELDAVATETLEGIRGRLLPNLDELEADLLRLEGMRSLRRELADPRNVTARRPVFDPRQPRRVGDPVRGALGAMRAALTVSLRAGTPRRCRSQEGRISARDRDAGLRLGGDLAVNRLVSSCHRIPRVLEKVGRSIGHLAMDTVLQGVAKARQVVALFVVSRRGRG